MNFFPKQVRSLLVVALALVSGAAYANQGVEVGSEVSIQNGETVTGTVVDDMGPTIGATVLVVGTTNGVSTDIDGKFTLSGVNKGDVIEISYLGYKTQQVVFNGQTSLNVTLESDSQMMGEVVVTALGIKRQARSLGYSTTKVDGDDFALARDPNVGNALSGKVAGVSVSGNATGGGSSRVVIRGNASMTGNNMPLYVIDGVPYDNSNQGSAGTWGGLDMGDGLSNISADDIESVQVLKGVAASALYGYRGGNGAILITTKSGKKGQDVTIEVNNNTTFNTIYDQRDFQDVFGQGTEGLRPMEAQTAKDSATSNWGEALDGGTAVNFLGNEYQYSNIDNFKNFYETGITNASSVSIAGAGDNITYRFGTTYNVEKSILPNSGTDQTGFNFNTTYDVMKDVQLSVGANYVFDNANGRSNLSDANGNTNASLLWHANSFDIRWLEGAAGMPMGTAADGSELLSSNSVYFNNPYWLQYRKTNEMNRNRLTGSINLKWDVTEHIYAQGGIQRDGYSLEFKQVQPIGAAADPTGYMTQYQKNYQEMNYNFLVGYNQEFDDLSVSATFGGNRQVNVTEQYVPTDGGRPFIVDGLWSVSNLDPTDLRAKFDYTKYIVASFYGTLDLGWKNQLFLNMTARNDWFSTLAPESNSYLYPSVTGSWVFTDTFDMPEWFNFGKLRTSWAMGSNGTSPYQNLMSYKLTNFKVGDVLLATKNSGAYPNEYLKPVEITEQEVGLNLSFLEGRLSFDMAYYVKNTKNDIALISTSSASGFSSAIQNVGEIRNRGFEFLVDATPIRKENFSWNTTFNFANNNSEVLYLGGPDRLAIDGATSRVGSVGVYNIVGSSYGEIVGYKYKRDEQGNLLLSNGLPQSNGEQVSLGNGVYKITGGWANTLRYKDFTLSFLVDFKFGADLFSGTNYTAYSSGLHQNTLEGRTAENPNGTYVFAGIDEATGEANTIAVTSNDYFSEIASENIAEEFVYDASFIKLRELSLGYNFKMPESSFVKSLNLSIVARNLWTILKYTDNIDPEAAYNSSNGQGLELNGYPYTRNIGLNVNLKF